MSTEQTFDGIHLDLTGDKQLSFSYEASDMQVAYRRTTPHSWDDLIRWLETKGGADNELTPGEVVAMVEDLRSLKQNGTPFTNNPDQAYREAHQQRGANDQRHAGLHQQILSESTRIRRDNERKHDE